MKFSATKKNRVNGSIYSVDYELPIKEANFENTLFRKMKTEPLSLSQIEGCWFDSLSFDNKIMWDNRMPSYKLLLKKDVLPSDWRFREDILWLLYEKPELSLEWKLRLEEAQRDLRGKRQKFFSQNKHRKIH